MKPLSIIILCIFVAGCAVLSTSSYKDMMYLTESTSEAYSPPPPAPPPASPPATLPKDSQAETEGHGYKIRAESMRETEQKQSMITRPSASYKKRVPSIEEATEQISDQLFKTAAAITGDTVGSIEDTLNITLIIDPTLDKESLRQQLESENSTAKITVTDTKISALAWPELIAPDFTVTPAVASEQAVTKDGPTEWSWQLKPKAGGEFTVLVDLYAIVYVGDKQTKRKYKTLRQPITITVPPTPWYMHVWDWVNQRWDWLWTVVLLPVIGYLINRRKKKKKKK